MPHIIKKFLILILSLTATLLQSCSGEEMPPYVAPMKISSETLHDSADSLMYVRHKDASLKILAIGNSFTINAATYLPWFAKLLHGDSICMARLTQSGCSLSMHWNNHTGDLPNYDLYYSDNGGWKLSQVKTIDEALQFFDWDVIVIQQQSGLAGIISSYYPLPNLLQLFRETNPGAKIAWHYTWPYKEGTQHSDFPRYDNDPLKMYEAILEAGDFASSGLDFKIPSATLIWEMRSQYPEVEDQFSTDGYHIINDMALYALSSLWHECLIAPFTGISVMSPPSYPDEIDAETFARAREIIRILMGYPEEDPNSVPMLRD